MEHTLVSQAGGRAVRGHAVGGKTLPLAQHSRRFDSMDLHYYRLEAEILTEVYLANLAVGENRLRRAGRDNFTVVEYIGALADAQCLAHIVIGD